MRDAFSLLFFFPLSLPPSEFPDVEQAGREQAGGRVAGGGGGKKGGKARQGKRPPHLCRVVCVSKKSPRTDALHGDFLGQGGLSRPGGNVHLVWDASVARVPSGGGPGCRLRRCSAPRSFCSITFPRTLSTRMGESETWVCLTRTYVHRRLVLLPT